MKKRLSWEKIRENYSGQWVELVDCEWEWHEASPRQARVSASSDDRSSLLSEIRLRGSQEDSIIIHIGTTQSLYRPNANLPHSE